MPALKATADDADDEDPGVDYLPMTAVENIQLYCQDGYHPVELGETLGKHYHIVHKLGFGTYSTTWLAVHEETGQYVAVKVGAGYSNPLEATFLRCLQIPRSFNVNTIRSVIPPFLDEFKIKGPNGKHRCYVTPVAGASLYHSKAYIPGPGGLFRLDVARAMAAQLVTAVAHLHGKGYVHGDVRLTNVLLHLPFDIDELSVEALYEEYGEPVRTPVVRADGQPLTPGVPKECIKPVWLGKICNEITLAEAKIMLVDYGETYIPEIQARDDSNTPDVYKPPEALLKPLLDSQTSLTFSSDIWTLACSLWDLVAYFPLFKGYFSKEDSITAEQVAVLGRLPPGWWSVWGRKTNIRRRRFDLHDEPFKPDQYPPWETRFETAVQEPRRERGMERMGKKEKNAFFSMLGSMLEYHPENRCTAQQVLESDWMVKWARPAYQKVMELQGQEDF